MPPQPDEKIFGMAPEKGRWTFVVLCMVINLCLGTIYSWSVFVGPLTEYFKGTLGQAVTANEILMPFSVFLAFFAIAMPFTGKYIETLGPRKVTIIGGAMTGLGWLLASMVTSVWMLYLLYGVIGGIGVGIAYGVPVAVAARWFPDRRGTAVGLALLGFGFSAFVTANIAGYLISTTGVMSAFRMFGLAFIVLITLLSLPLRFPPPSWKPRGWNPEKAGSGSQVSCECNRAEMIRSSSFFGLWACYFIGCLSGLMAISIAKPVGTDVGVAAGLATILVGIFAVFNGGGRPLFGACTDRLSPQKTAIVSFILIAAAALLIWQSPGVLTYVIAFAVLWGCLGGWLAIAPTATASYFGTSDYPRCYGVVFLAYGAGAIAGPQLAGFIKTSTGSYLGVFPYVFMLAAIGIVIAFFLMKPPSGPKTR